jgi:hypothetical protein
LSRGSSFQLLYNPYRIPTFSGVGEVTAALDYNPGGQRVSYPLETYPDEPLLYAEPEIPWHAEHLMMWFEYRGPSLTDWDNNGGYGINYHFEIAPHSGTRLPPIIFIGSANTPESRNVVKELSRWIKEGRATALPWYRCFPPNSWALGQLVRLSRRVQGAVVVFGQDDFVSQAQPPMGVPSAGRRGGKARQLAPRDNVLIEYGLFTSALGIKNVAVIRVGNAKVATNLSGLTNINYDPNKPNAEARESFNAWIERLKVHPDRRNEFSPWEMQTPVWFDCTDSEFVSHLAETDEVTIIGLTNQNLVAHLSEAWNIRRNANGNRASPWKSLRVIFLAKHLLKYVDDGPATSPGSSGWSRRSALDLRSSNWDNGVNDVRKFLYERSLRVANAVDIRHSDRPLPFVGQMYGGNRVRLSFLVPGRDTKTNCYINLRTSAPPCGAVPPPFFVSQRDEQERLCRATPQGENGTHRWVYVSDRGCESCSYNSTHAPCEAICDAVERIANSATPLFAANVVVTVDENRAQANTCSFCWLVPEHEWRLAADQLGTAVACLHSFVILSWRDKIFLYMRANTNARDEIGLWSLPSRKVYDEDFFDRHPPAMLRDYRNKIQRLQEAYFAGEEYRSIQEEVSQIFARKILRVETGMPLAEQALLDAGKNAAMHLLLGKVCVHFKRDRACSQDRFLFVFEKIAVPPAPDEGDAGIVRLGVLLLRYRLEEADAKKLQKDKSSFLLVSHGELHRLVEEEPEKVTPFVRRYVDVIAG